MPDNLGTVRVAVVQAASAFLDRDRSVAKAIQMIDEAARGGAKLVVFPEGFIPAHPLWYHFHAGTSRAAMMMASELFKNSVVIGSDVTDALAIVAKRNDIWVVMGVCEKRAGTTGTLWNSIVHFTPDGHIAAVQRKLTPTVGERMVHTGGGLNDITTPSASFGRISSLLCAENFNPLLTFTITSQYPVIHAALWPSHFPKPSRPMRDVILMGSQAFAYQNACFVLNAAGTVEESAVETIGATEDDYQWLRDPKNTGGSSIISPSGTIIAATSDNREQILFADLNLNDVVYKKIIHDYAGHYNRADVFSLKVKQEESRLVDAPWINNDHQQFSRMDRSVVTGVSGTDDFNEAIHNRAATYAIE
jgi:nitrilase